MSSGLSKVVEREPRSDGPPCGARRTSAAKGTSKGSSWLAPLREKQKSRYAEEVKTSSGKAPRVHHSIVLNTSEDRPCRLVVVSDTHSSIHPNARKVVSSLAPDYLLHGGDIGDLAVLKELEKWAPLTAVRGNIDGQVADVADSIDIEIRTPQRTLVKLLLLHIAVYGPKLRAEAWRLAKDVGARIVVCGHSHVPFMGRDKGLVMFNPGSIGPRRGTLPITLGLLEVGLQGINLRHIDCETGETWLP